MIKRISIQPIPYQGSKRSIAPKILSYFPIYVNRIIEPFAGSSALSLTAAANSIAGEYFLNDNYKPLMNLWDLIINYPYFLIDKYTYMWNEQLSDPKAYYFHVRDRFNSELQPEDFFYLMSRAVKGAIRFNKKGEFNQSPDNRRLGRKPESMKKQILQASTLFKDKVTISSKDYEHALTIATPKDIVYMDPPYQGTSTQKNPRYFESLDLDRFLVNLYELNKRNIPYLISFDGSLGKKKYGKDLPKDLNLKKININTGRSTQATLNGINEKTIESLYISKDARNLVNCSSIYL